MIQQKHLDEFAYLGNTAYLDCCSLGMQPRRGLELCARFQREFVESLGRICLGGYDAVRATAAERFAQLIGGTAEQVFFAENTTQGFQLLCSQLPFGPGEKVLLCPQDYPSVTSGWLMRGVPVVCIPLRRGALVEEEILEVLDREPIRAVSLAFVQSCSGYRLDLARIGRACRERGIWFCVDAIQGLGRNQVDVERDCIDVLSCGGFKGLLGVLGAGAHWCRRELLRNMRPVFCDETNAVCCFGDGGSAGARLERASQLTAGSANTYGIAAMSEGMGLLLEIGIESIHAHVMELEKHYRDSLADLKLDWIGGCDEGHFSGNAVFMHDGTRTALLAEELRKNEIMVHLHPDRLRIGIHYYNTHEHIDRMVSVVRRVFG